MDKHAHGVTFCCPLQEIFHWRSNDAFVDDTTGFANQFLQDLQGKNTLHQVVAAMQHDAQLWNDLLHVSGGKLEFSKCLYYIVSWYWENGKGTITPATTLGLDLIHLHDEHGNITVVAHRDCTKAHKTLGHMKTPTGIETEELDRLRDKSNTWTNAIRYALLTRTKAHSSFWHIWLPSLIYGLVSTNLS